MDALFDLLGTPAVATEEPTTKAPRALDPRSDLTDDASLWQRVLEVALKRDGDRMDGVYALLYGVRCCGARLVKPAGRLKLVPRLAPKGVSRDDGDGLGDVAIDGNTAWSTDAEWAAFCADHLAPQKGAIASVLAEAVKPPRVDWREPDPPAEKPVPEWPGAGRKR
jgi:hypothetical protein